MKHLGIVAHSIEGAALCLRAFCQEGFKQLGPDEHPDVTLDCIALARSMPAWESGDHASIRDTLAVSVERLAKARADFFACPDNTAHLALDLAGEPLALPGLHIAEVVADQAARDGRTRVGILGTKYLMDGPIYPRVLAARGIAAELPGRDDRVAINEIIFGELLNGVFTDASHATYASSRSWPAGAATRLRSCAPKSRSSSRLMCRPFRPSTRPACWPRAPLTSR